MYHSITSVSTGHDPIIVEGTLPTQILIFNAGPSNIEAMVWNEWNGKVENSFSQNSKEPNFRLELRVGNQKIISGSFVRLKIKKELPNANGEFAAVGIRIMNDLFNAL